VDDAFTDAVHDVANERGISIDRANLDR